MLDNKGFDLWAEWYDKSVELSEENNEYPFAGYKDVLNTIYDIIHKKEKAKILDIGFGTGILTKKLYDDGYEIHGIDFSEEMVEIAKEKMPLANLINYDFSKGLPEEIVDKQFDYIISTYAMHHLQDEDKKKFIIELGNHLTEDGKIIIGDIAFETRELLEQCKSNYDNYWDDEEIYFVFDELKESLLDKDISFKAISHCSGVIQVSRSHSNNMEYEIIHLPKEKWEGTIIPIKYTTDKYYDVIVNKRDKGFTIEIEKKDFGEAVNHIPEEYDFPDRLYKEHWENAYAWGVLADGELVAAIETNEEIWSNRLRITELWVAEKYQKQGIGHALIEIAKEQARRQRCRAIILETQSCNVNAIDFYMHEGFSLIGLDTCCYKNNDLQRKEVRLEFGWFPEEKRRLSREEIEIRMETESDWYNAELMTQHAFWNKHHLGGNEHYLVHKLRQHKDYLPELSRIAVKDGDVIGSIMYSKAKIIDEKETYEIITFGPLCVDPKWQGCGVGELLLKETMTLAENKGYRGVVIFGEPDYYPRMGFKTCDKFNITTADGKNFDAFMGIELIKGGMKDIKGKFYGSGVFDNLPKEEVEKYNKNFPPLKRLRFPGQWD